MQTQHSVIVHRPHSTAYGVVVATQWFCERRLARLRHDCLGNNGDKRFPLLYRLLVLQLC